MSFLSVEPESRSLLESYTNTLLAQFDIQLNIVTDRYLAFFQERRSIEATYIASLRKLYRKAETVCAEPTTTRAAWDNVIDDLEREANTQQAFVDILDNDVIGPLTRLKESNDVTRKRIEEDLKESAAQYADHAENKISKLQEAYIKKYYSCRQENIFGADPAKSQDASDDDCRSAASTLNELRYSRVENLREGYDCLEKLVFTPTLKEVFLKYMNGMITARTNCDESAKSTRTEVEKALAGRDTSDLRASFRRAFSFSIPPLTLYRNSRPGGYSPLIFGVPLVDHVMMSEDKVPKVMRMCIEEVEKRGLGVNNIYSSGCMNHPEVLELRHKFEGEKSFSLSSTNNICIFALLLKLYLWELPEPLLTLSLQDIMNHAQNRTKYSEDGFSLLQMKIRELHPVQRATLGALLRHLLCLASYRNEKRTPVTVEALSWQFRDIILGRNAVRQGKGPATQKDLVLIDLIQNANTLFDERHPPFPPVSPPDVAETT